LFKEIGRSLNALQEFNFYSYGRGGYSVNTEYVKVPISPDFVDNFSDIFLTILPDFV